MSTLAAPAVDSSRRHPLQRYDSPSKGVSGALHVAGLISFYHAFKYLVDNPNQFNDSFGWHLQFLTILGITICTMFHPRPPRGHNLLNHPLYFKKLHVTRRRPHRNRHQHPILESPRHRYKPPRPPGPPFTPTTRRPRIPLVPRALHYAGHNPAVPAVAEQSRESARAAHYARLVHQRCVSVLVLDRTVFCV